MAKPKVRYDFDNIRSLRFSRFEIGFNLADGDTVDIRFNDSKQGEAMIFEEIRDFIKWYGKDNTKELKETSKILLELLEKKSSEDLARSRGEDA
tara:strand:- start:245 stop:526 length:282 start_codon:yes stop_codon:yes gene_type:complete